MRLIHLHARDVHLLHGLLMMGVSAVGRHPLEAVDGLEIDGTNVRRPLITDTPPLTFQQLFHGRFGQLAPRHQGALPLGELPVAQGATQSFNVPGLASPGAMRNIACAGAIELYTVWIRARESGISLWRWRRQYHSSPPVAGNGPKDTEPTPVVPRYYSPGLPELLILQKLRVSIEVRAGMEAQKFTILKKTNPTIGCHRVGNP
jgi:hypothetical protein